MDLGARIRAFIVENVLAGDSPTAFTDEDSFLDKGIIDSTGVLELVTFIEEEFGVEVWDEDLVPDNFDSIARLARYVASKTNGRPVARGGGLDSPSRPAAH